MSFLRRHDQEIGVGAMWLTNHSWTGAPLIFPFDLNGAFSGRALLIFPETNNLELVRAVVERQLSLDDIVDLEDKALAETGNIILNSWGQRSPTCSTKSANGPCRWSFPGTANTSSRLETPRGLPCCSSASDSKSARRRFRATLRCLWIFLRSKN